jgi:ABC-type transport system involved in cytochrome c biogenesis permease subunit
MWARVVEVMLACWLAISPFVFRHSAEATMWWVNDLAGAFLVAFLALASFWKPLRGAHLAILLVALWLIGFAFATASYPAAPALQNHILVGLLLLMIALIPTEADLPPPSWRDLLAREKKQNPTR